MAKKKQIELSISDFTENFLYLGNEPFSLADYPHMRRIYNSPAQDIVMKFSRQCVVDDQDIELWDGKVKKAKDLQEGDRLITINDQTLFNEIKPVKNIWDNGEQNSYLIQTKMGHKAKVTFNHPFLTPRGWVEAKDLTKKDLIATASTYECALKEGIEAPYEGKGLRDIQKKTKSYERGDPISPEIFSYNLKQLETFISTFFRYEGFVNPTVPTAKITLWDLNWIKAVEHILLRHKVRSEIYWEPTGAITLDVIDLKKFMFTFIRKAYHENFEPKYKEKYKEVYYDPIEEITSLGKQSSTAIEIEDTHTFYIDHLATHNTAKSTTLANIMMSRAIMHGDSGQLYVSPAVAQTQEFSRSKLEPVIMNSPLIRNNYVSPKLVQNVLKKKFTNQSRIDLKYALLSADRIRGISADYNYFDECYAPNMQVLAKEGWKYFKNITLEDSLATVDSENNLEYQEPTRLVKKDYEGDILNYTHKSFKLSVTEGHNLYLNRGNNWELLPAIKANKSDFNMLLASGEELEFKKEENRVKRESFKGKVYCATVPNGTLIVRDDKEKTAVISGNCQDLLKDVITVVQETMSRSLIKKTVYAGTPKRTKGTLADLWFGSTQHEYAVKSSVSGYWNILGPDNIGRTGLIDKKSGEPLDLRKDKGEWVSTYMHNKDKPKMEGYRVCLLHFAHSPWVNWDKDVIYKMENTSTALFYNETLGLEYDAGAIPITKDEVIRACNSDIRMKEDPERGQLGRLSVMGIDYGPVNSDASHTCISIVQERDGRMQVVYAKKFLGKEADYTFIHNEIPRLMKKWNCRVLAADYGMGEAPNSEFRSRLGPEKVLAFQHLHTQKEIFKYNAKMRAFTLNRNYVMNKYFEMLKKGHLRLPHWEDFSDMAQDIRNIVIEFDEEKNSQKYVNVGPDDFNHATIFAVMSLISLSSNNLNKFLL